MSETAIRLRARYDGRALILEEPADLPQSVLLDVWTEPQKTKTRCQVGSARGLITMREEFDDPIPDFGG